MKSMTNLLYLSVGVSVGLTLSSLLSSFQQASLPCLGIDPTLPREHGDDMKHPAPSISFSNPSVNDTELKTQVVPLGTDTTLVNFDKIPSFMRDYFEWHGKQLQQLHHDGRNATNDEYLNNYKFLIMRCVGEDQCGGTSDRIKAFPLFVWYAATTGRILFFRWDRPAPLEAFMLPGNIWNWTVPEAVSRKIEQLDPVQALNPHKDWKQPFSHFYSSAQGHGWGKGRKLLQERVRDRKIWLVEGNEYTGGKENYLDLVNGAIEIALNASRTDYSTNGIFSHLKPADAIYENFYHDLFHATFQPSRGVKKLLDSYFVDEKQPSELRLPVPLKRNQYAVAHYRAEYPREPYLKHGRSPKILRDSSMVAVDCAMNRAKQPAVLFMSDKGEALKVVQDEYSNRTNSTHVWTSLDLKSASTETELPVKDPLHLNFDKSEDVSGYYPIFVDIFLMSYSSCVVHGAGGFGRLGILVSHQASCGMGWRERRDSLENNCTAYEQ